ncbi:PP2C family protein-serine/threonine phosphatase [Streptomyces ficellus]|uniref:PP2C family protein-serine/threonine phosphatase n=1 Tax=Streptomyces ficellus TaxID=1977088 RepID=A0ABT7ZAC1_9ACTN|nr:PP2C family protein-serine/threonine phosphatase [Streptomyces ficellus]MDN3296466.1 PP2C family protein-serine/threonine phosphatase [Streptomyces ficellus]
MGQRARDGYGGDRGNGGRGNRGRGNGGRGNGGGGRGNRGGREGLRRFIRAVPALMIAGGVAYDLATPPRFTAIPLFAAAPLVAAPFFAPGATALAGAVAVLAVLALHLVNGTLGEAPALTEVLTVVTVSALALLINRVVRRSGERLASARVIAETAQRAVLPTPAERIGGLQVAARYEAAQADAFIGGDLFAVQDTPHGVRLVVGDVRGKGMGAVEAVAVVIGAFREAAEHESSLEGVAQRLERALAREGTRRDGLDAVEGFTTAVLAEIPRGEAVVRVVDRGHPEPLMLYADGRVELLEAAEPALPLGMSDLGTWPDRAYQVPYPAGATLLLYTDGLSEARDANGVFYDPVERLAGRIFPGPDALLDALVDDVRRHTGGGATDDLALLAVSRPAEGQPARRRTMPVVPGHGA